MQERPSKVMRRLYNAYCVALFTVLGLTLLVINLFLPSLRQRRRMAGVTAPFCARREFRSPSRA